MRGAEKVARKESKKKKKNKNMKYAENKTFN